MLRSEDICECLYARLCVCMRASVCMRVHAVCVSVRAFTRTAVHPSLLQVAPRCLPAAGVFSTGSTPRPGSTSAVSSAGSGSAGASLPGPAGHINTHTYLIVMCTHTQRIYTQNVKLPALSEPKYKLY